MEIYNNYQFKCGLESRNRLVMAPMTTYSSNDDLTLSKEEEKYYFDRSKEVGMVITAAVAVSANAQAFNHQISAKSDFYLDSLKRLSSAIKRNGALAIMQIHHGGRMNIPNLFEGQKIYAPSSVKALRDNLEVPIELSHEEILETIEDFKNATIRAIKAGFDGVEIHGANTYLIQQFYSPHSNIRKDMWGERLKFPLLLTDEIIKVVEDFTQDPFIVGYRFSPEELETPGITLEDTLVLVDHLCNKKLDYLHVSLGLYNKTSSRDLNDKELIAHKLLKTINKRLPLIGVGGIDNQTTLNDAFKIGYDLCAIGLGIIADKFIVSNIQNNFESNKNIDLELLPKGLNERLSRVEESLLNRGYKLVR